MSEAGADTTQQHNEDEWAGAIGDRWLAHLDGLEAMVEPIGNALIAQADYAPGEHVVDIGSGGGGTTCAIAQKVGPDGSATGLDIAPMLVAEAAKRAAAKGIANAHFECGDAGTSRPDAAPFDRLFSRFGSMFFEDPHAAFANLHTLLKSGGRIDLAVWGAPPANLWMMAMMGVVGKYFELPKPEPRAPGPFAFADPAYFEEVLTGAGFRDVEFGAFEGRLAAGGPGSEPRDAARFMLTSAGVGKLFEEQDAATQQAMVEDLTTVFEQHHVPGEGVMMDAKVWMVSAIA